MRVAVRRTVGVVIVLHGLIHLLGAAVGLAGAHVTAFTRPIGGLAGALWLLAAVLLVVAGVGLTLGRRHWWTVGVAALAVSQLSIIGDWADARAGTAANVLLTLAIAHAVAAEGPTSLRARYRRLRAQSLADVPATPLPPVTEHDLAALPPQVAGYLRRVGVVGRPRPAGVRARMTGRIRGGPDQPWMAFTAEQLDVWGPRTTRLFCMDATMRGLPADVLHVQVDGAATMEVRLASVLAIVRARGPQMDRAEAVTLVNDIAVLAPALLADPAIGWSTLDAHRVRGTFPTPTGPVHADLVVDDAGDLVDFVSDDRLAASPDGRSFTARRWSTPLGDHGEIGGLRLARAGQGYWHPEDGSFVYLELRFDELEVL